MPDRYNYISFNRSRFGFLITFFGLIILAAAAYGLTLGLIRVSIIFILLIGLIIAFFYEFYLATEPVIEITTDSLMIKEIYHPVIKWRFIYKKHVFGINTILHIQIRLTKNNRPKHMSIEYHDGTRVRRVDVNKRDISDFESFTQFLIKNTPAVNKDYIKG